MRILLILAAISAFFVFGTAPPLTSTQTLDPASCAASSVCLTSVTITGVIAGEMCAVTAPAAPLAGTAYDCYASATNTIQMQTINPTTSAKDPASASFTFYITR